MNPGIDQDRARYVLWLGGGKTDSDIIRGAFHSQKISYTFGKNPFVFMKNPPKIRKNPFVVKESRTLFQKSEMPLVSSMERKRCAPDMSGAQSKNWCTNWCTK